MFALKGIEADDHFNICFLTGASYEADDIALQITINLKDKAVVFKNRKDGQCGEENRRLITFKDSEPVDLRIRALYSKFQVSF